jgi:mono/diheme cytochrome c family protein
MRAHILACTLALPGFLATARTEGSEIGESAPPPGVSFAKDIVPILKASCLECHNPKKLKGKLDLSTYDGLKKGGKEGQTVVPGDPAKSNLVKQISGDQPEMPSKGDPLKKDQVDLIARWIKEGAKNN